MGCHDLRTKKCSSHLSKSYELHFHQSIGRIVEIYIDDVVIKSKSHKEHLVDLKETLECIRKHGFKMNPNKCAFGASAGQFLGFMVHE